MQPEEPWSSGQWAAHFRRNCERSLALPDAGDASLTAAERHAIESSIQVFQLGESSEGRHLLEAARAYSMRIDDPDYLEATRLFIGEEQRHARYLAAFMRMEGITLSRKHWTDSVFRRLRRGMGLELSVSVLVTAEIIATVYYVALRDATNSATLRDICDQIIADEDFHIRFQAERLAQIRLGRSSFYRHLASIGHRILLLGTCMVVWQGHRRVFRRGGVGFREFCRSCGGVLRRVLVRVPSLRAASGGKRVDSSRSAAAGGVWRHDAS